MEHTSANVAEGKLIHEASYAERANKYTEIEIGGSKIDYYDADKKIIHEVKKSSSMEESHIWQVKYYIWLLKQRGVTGVTGIIEYPKQRETRKVNLEAEDEAFLEKCIKDIDDIANTEACPERELMTICKKCSYFDFCYIDE